MRDETEQLLISSQDLMSDIVDTQPPNSSHVEETPQNKDTQFKRTSSQPPIAASVPDLAALDMQDTADQEMRECLDQTRQEVQINQ